MKKPKLLATIIVTATVAACMHPQRVLVAQSNPAAQADSAQIAIQFGQYIRGEFRGTIAFDSSLICRNGLLCAENEKGKNPLREAQRKSFHSIVVTTVGGKIIPIRQNAVCVPAESENCRLKTDYYIRVMDPVINSSVAYVNFDFAGNTRSLTEDRVYTQVRRVNLLKTGGRWAVDSVEVTSIR